MQRMNRIKLSLATVALACAAFGALGEARAQETFEPEAGGTTKPATTGGQQSLFLYSPIGPGQGHGTIGMGGRTIIVIPMYDLNYVRGISDNVDFLLALDTLGLISFADIGVRARIAGGPGDGAALGVKAAATTIFAFSAIGKGAAGFFIGGFTPGAMVSFGSRSTQFTLGVDVPIFIGGAAFASGDGSSGSTSTTHVTPAIRPSATIEFSVGATTNMYVQVQGYYFFEDEGIVLAPLLAVGAAW